MRASSLSHAGISMSNIRAATMRKMKITTTTRVGKLSWSMNARMKSHDLTRTMLFQGQYTPVGARDRM